MLFIRAWLRELPVKFHLNYLRDRLSPLHRTYDGGTICGSGAAAIKVSRIKRLDSSENWVTAVLYFQEELIQFYDGLELCPECKMAFATGLEDPADCMVHHDPLSLGLRTFIEQDRLANPLSYSPGFNRSEF